MATLLARYSLEQRLYLIHTMTRRAASYYAHGDILRASRLCSAVEYLLSTIEGGIL
jgi:hypothetical protein